MSKPFREVLEAGRTPTIRRNTRQREAAHDDKPTHHSAAGCTVADMLARLEDRGIGYTLTKHVEPSGATGYTIVKSAPRNLAEIELPLVAKRLTPNELPGFHEDLATITYDDGRTIRFASSLAGIVLWAFTELPHPDAKGSGGLLHASYRLDLREWMTAFARAIDKEKTDGE